MPFESPLGVMSLPRLRATRERARVRRHIAGAARKARGRAIALDRLPMLNRLLLLDELAIYRRGGQFPINRESRRVPVPVFVDEYGTRCAVGHLMEVSGQGPLVQHIARTRNNARVRELAALPEMRAWLAAAGLEPLAVRGRVRSRHCRRRRRERLQ